MGVSKNDGDPKSSILIGFSIINNPFWGTTIFGNIHILYIYTTSSLEYIYIHMYIYLYQFSRNGIDALKGVNVFEIHNG